jgi:hypothetical protein
VDDMSGRPLGFAEDSAPAPTPPGNRSQELTQLNAAFERISDPKVRKRILELVEGLADDQKHRSQPKRRR